MDGTSLGDFLSDEFQSCITKAMQDMRNRRIQKLIERHERKVQSLRRKIKTLESEIATEERILRSMK
jgi:hypothetical protein